MVGHSYRRHEKPQYSRFKVKPTTCRQDKVVHRKDFHKEDIGRLPIRIPIEKGRLTKYDYSTKLPTEKRREALKKAVNAYGALSVWQKLNAMITVRKNTHSKAREVFESDAEWIKEQYKTDGFVS